MEDRLTIFAQVLLPLPVPNTYTYRVPVEWNELVQIGQRVSVQFGARKIYAGILVDFSDQPPVGYTANYLLEILDDEPIVSPTQLKFWNWIASYYMCHPGEVMAAALPAGYRLQSESIISLSPDFDEDDIGSIDEKEGQILALLITKRQITVDEAAKACESKSPMKYIKSLYTRGYVLMHEEVKDSYKPKTETYYTLAACWEVEDTAKALLEQLEKKAPKQANVILALFGYGKQGISSAVLKEKYHVESSHLKALEKKALIIAEKKVVDRLSIAGAMTAFELTPAQSAACAQTQEAFDEGKNALLHGETGTGKTFIYQHFIQECLQAGKQALYLIPEVALTEQLVMRLSQFFGPKMAVWHNYYSGSVRTELYQKIANGEIQLLVGARSAVFAPFASLGLIVIDEEHENSFKQFDKRPMYHGRDAALQLGAMRKCPVLMGTATPSYDMLQLAADGKLEKVTLAERFVMAPPPLIELVNVGEAKRQNRMKQAFSAYMLEEIQNTLDAGAQVIVFQNRKGYVPYISCDFCGHTTHCVNCDISLTYYKSLNTQKCNYCGFTRDTEKQCPDCGSTSLSMRGFGTERIAEELEIYFPEARITRFDQESIRKKSDFQRILNGFENKEIDILVGTQLLSKGLDFENVGLVCIPDADMLLNIPDFRSHERAFQQMHQVAGRSGRGTKQGKVIIQSYQPSHPVIQAVKNAAFEELAAFEIPLRKSLSYPPFTRLIRITLRHKDFVLCQNAADLYANAIRKYLMDRVVGPQSPGIGRIRGYYLQQLLVKMNVGKDDITRIKKYLSDAALHVQKTNDFKGLWFDFDVDPV